ncbi:hypothetical protein AgCh_023185 [Apium graveolens]
MRNKASTDVSKASTDNIHQRMSASTDKASTANASMNKASMDKASMDKASTDESFNGCLYFGMSEDQIPIILVQTSDNQKYLKGNMEAEQIVPWLKDYMDGKLNLYVKSEPIPEINNEPLKVVVRDCIQDVVFNSRKNGWSMWCLVGMSRGALSTSDMA